MPNWKKVIVSGSDASLTDVTINDWGSVSASLASIEAGGASQTLQDVTDNGATTTNSITIDPGTLTINESNNAGEGGDTIYAGGYKTVNAERKSNYVEDNDLGVLNLYKTSYKLSDNTLTSIPDGKYFYQSQYQYRDGTGASDFAYGFKFLGQRGSSGGDTSNEASIFKIGISTNSGTWNNAIFRIHGNSLNGGGNGYIHMFNPIINEALLISSSVQAIEAYTYGLTQTLKSGQDEDPYNDTADLKTIEIATDQFAVSSSFIDLPNVEENPSGNSFRILVGGHESGQSGPHFNGQRGTGLVKYITSQSLFEGTGIISGSVDNYGEWNLAGDADTTDVTSNKFVKFPGGQSITGTGTEANPYIMDIRPTTLGTNATGSNLLISSNLNVAGNVGIGTNKNTILTSGKITVPDGNLGVLGSTYSASTYAGATVDYVVYNSGRTNQRTGMVTVTSNTTEVIHSELVTTDIGNTNGMIITTTIGSGNFRRIMDNDSGASVDVIYNIRLLQI